MPTKSTKQMKRKPRRQSGKTDSRIDLESRMIRTVRSTGLVFPTKWRRTLRYVDDYTLTSTTGSLASQQWIVNSLYDPDYTGVGHQPRFFDQLCASAGPYQKYRVLGGRVTIQFRGDNGTAADSMSAGFSDLVTLPAASYQTGELPGWRTVLVPKVYAPAEKLMFAFRVSDIENVSPSAVQTEDGFTGTYGASPTNPAYFSVIYQNDGGVTSTVYILATLEFDVDFEEPVLVATS